MNKSILFSILATTILVADAIPDKVKEQNNNVIKLAAEELSKELPKRVDAFTQLIAIGAKNETLSYTFEINASSSDEDIKKKDKTRMQKAVTKGICNSSKRFLDSGISISYIYTSFKSKKKLFVFDVNKSVCDYPPNIN